MKLYIFPVAFLLASCAAEPPERPLQQQLPQDLVGRTAGAPVTCVQTTQVDALRTGEGNRHVLLYGSGRTIFANQLGSCGYGSDDVLVTEQFGPQLCRGDIVRSFDRTSRIPGPACVLGDFVPYTRP